MKILVINAGSSSLKYQLLDIESEFVIAKGLVERIGAAEGRVEQKSEKGVIEQVLAIPSHFDAMKLVIAALTDKEKGVISDMSLIDAVGHRVLHGGATFSASVIINDEVMQAIRDNIPLGPLHNPANLQGIEACQEIMPGVPQVAVFDTAFHQTMPPKAFLYALPYEYYEDLKIRRYGFHGTSHRFISGKAQDKLEAMGYDRSKTRIITCHLGNGSSLAAIEGGKCIDTSMGLTPLEGVVMGTRSGSLDPAVVGFISERTGKNASQVVDILNKKSGMLGLSGVSSDLRDIDAACNEGNTRAIQARESMCYSIKKYIGSYAAAMNGVDCIVFAGGVGENDRVVRKMVLSGLDYLGVELDEEKNQSRGDADLTGANSKVKIFVISTNEELAIAQDTYELVTAAQKA